MDVFKYAKIYKLTEDNTAIWLTQTIDMEPKVVETIQKTFITISERIVRKQPLPNKMILKVNNYGIEVDVEKILKDYIIRAIRYYLKNTHRVKYPYRIIHVGKNIIIQRYGSIESYPLPEQLYKIVNTYREQINV